MDAQSASGGWIRRPANGAAPARRISPLLAALTAASAAGFLLSAAAFVLPGLPRVSVGSVELTRRGQAVSPVAGGAALSAARAPAALTPDERELVLSYAAAHRADDPLVPVLQGVQAKRSNVEGVRVGNRTVYYDILGHQSFGPLAAGRVRQADVETLSREGDGAFVVLLYSLKR